MSDISIVIPTKNRMKFIEKSLKLASKIKDGKEILLIDSTDKPTTISSEFNLVKYFHRPKLNIAASRQFGVITSKSDYVLEIDDDVSYKPQDISALVEILNEHPDIAEVFGVGVVNQFEALLSKSTLIETTSGGCLVLLRKKLFTEGKVTYDVSLPFLEDKDVTIQMWLAGYRTVRHTKVKWSHYKIHNDHVNVKNEKYVNNVDVISEPNIGYVRRSYSDSYPILLKKYPFSRVRNHVYQCSAKMIKDYLKSKSK